MKYVIAPDSFKGSITSIEAAKAISRAVRETDGQAEVVELPMADGGEGTVDAVLLSRGGDKITRQVEDPLGRVIEASYGWMEEEKTAVIETAAASGLPLLKTEELNPYEASSYGTGQLLRDALEKGAETIILGLGGSATVDAGVGLFQALGLKVYGENDREISRVGGRLDRITKVDATGLEPKLKQVNIIVASDVTNPLLGRDGAVAIFGPQKGISAQHLETFEAGMASFAKVTAEAVKHNVAEEPGSGAAGGIGFLLQSLLKVEFRSGLELMVELSRLEEHLVGADVVFTGEGKVDGQSLFGKVPVGVARAARMKGVPTVAFAGMIGDGLDRLQAEGLTVVIPIVDQPMALKEAMAEGERLLYTAATRAMQLIRLDKREIGRETK
ncbi:glycerate kinase [Sediminibacillus dalangtanensis]|uniref:Glycerate kinase n=1 Tax=Sediminibacillus dalangtanensis TaxID=2729421 RepID=A0ABX7VSB1_9BACI|nr:glycerate kinase [Sediminibacillus dalangtanensis]QTM98490.1 glycerate kinase [Sediminibacillus dalangtanensis]